MNASIHTEPNSLLLKRLVNIDSEDSIDSLQPGKVVLTLKEPRTRPDYRVFAERKEDELTFYSSLGVLRPGALMKWTTRRMWLHPGKEGVMDAHSCAYEHRLILVPGDENYDSLRSDLSSLGLM